MAGRINPLSACGNAYSRKLPIAKVAGVVVDWVFVPDGTIGSVGDVLVLLQAMRREVRRMRNM